MNRKANLVNNYFIQIYLTIIALLQSVALGNLVPHLISYFTSSRNSFFNVHTPPLLLTLLIIFIVWHHYVYGIIYLRWFPNILDAVIPFIISITQSFLIAFVEPQNTGDNMHQWIRSFAFLYPGRRINAFTVHVCCNDPAFSLGRPYLVIADFFPFAYSSI